MLTNTSTNEVLENTYDLNFIFKCLNKRGKSKANHLDHELLNLKYLNFSKNKSMPKMTQIKISETPSILIFKVLMNFIN